MGGGSASSSKKATEKDAMRKAIKDFEYLVGMPISTLTAEKIAELMKQRDTKTAELDTLKKKTPQKLWLEELDELEVELDKRDATIAEAQRLEEAKIAKARAKAKAKSDSKRGMKRGAEDRAASAPVRRKGTVEEP